jgi:hypothetical protein
MLDSWRAEMAIPLIHRLFFIPWQDVAKPIYWIQAAHRSPSPAHLHSTKAFKFGAVLGVNRAVRRLYFTTSSRSPHEDGTVSGGDGSSKSGPAQSRRHCPASLLSHDPNPHIHRFIHRHGETTTGIGDTHCLVWARPPDNALARSPPTSLGQICGGFGEMVKKVQS